MKATALGRPTWAEISLPALRRNFLAVKNTLSPEIKIMAVVKADAYGHGAVECARELESAGADWFCVALVEEAVELRRASVTRPILCVGGFWRGQAEIIVGQRLTPVIFHLEAAAELDAQARAAGRRVPYHLKVDTGLGRLGVSLDEIGEFVRALKRFDFLELEGMMTHFADADGDTTEYTDGQIDTFEQALAIVRREGFNPSVRHLASSAGLHAYPASHGTLVRTGASLYGLSRDVLTDRIAPLDVQPVMSLHTRIIQLKTVPAGTTLGYGRTFKAAHASQIATIPIGYADGWSRVLSNRGRVIVGGAFAPIVGRISMDLTMIDVTGIPNVALGEETILIGQSAGLRILIEEVAELCDSISYEAATGVTARVPRVYLSS
jgi:alanine racemase